MSEDRPAYAAGTEAPPTPAEIAERLRRLADEMFLLGAEMEYVGGFGVLRKRGTVLRDMHSLMRDWADEMTDDTRAAAEIGRGRG